MKTPIFYRTLRQLTVIFCLAFLFVACSDDEPTPAPTSVPLAPTATPTVAQPESPLNAPSDSPLPTPGAVTTTAQAAGAENVNVIPAAGAPVDPQTTATAGAVTGRIFVNDAQGFRPVTKIIVALAEIIKDENGKEIATGYDAVNSPRNDIRDDGVFVIENVPPGRYGIILDSVMTQVMIKEPENLDNSLLITVEADKVTDVSNLIYASLPLPGYTQ